MVDLIKTIEENDEVEVDDDDSDSDKEVNVFIIYLFEQYTTVLGITPMHTDMRKIYTKMIKRLAKIKSKSTQKENNK